jgi:hypothetical protein
MKYGMQHKVPHRHKFYFTIYIFSNRKNVYQAIIGKKSNKEWM